MASNWNAMCEAGLIQAEQERQDMLNVPPLTDEERQAEADEIEAAEQAEWELANEQTRREIEYDMHRL